MIDEGEIRSEAVIRALHPLLEIGLHGRNLISYHAIYRKFVMDHELMARQNIPEGASALQSLRRLIQNAFLIELMAFWENDSLAPQHSLSLPSALSRAEVELTLRDDLLSFPLPHGERSFDTATKRLRWIIDAVHRSSRYSRLKKFRNKYVAHRLSQTNSERKGEAGELPIYSDLDRLFLYAMLAMRELSKLWPLEDKLLTQRAHEAEFAVQKMLKAWNMRLGVPTPPG